MCFKAFTKDPGFEPGQKFTKKSLVFLAYFNEKGYPKSHKFKRKIRALDLKEAISKANDLVAGTKYCVREVMPAEW